MNFLIVGAFDSPISSYVQVRVTGLFYAFPPIHGPPLLKMRKGDFCLKVAFSRFTASRQMEAGGGQVLGRQIDSQEAPREEAVHATEPR